MNFLNNLKVKYKLLALIGVAVFGFVLLSVNFYRTMVKVEVSGQLYNNIISQKDLLADILPPPAYLVESYLVVHQIASTNNKEEIPGLIAQVKKLRGDFETRHDHWQNALDDAKTRDVFLKTSYEPAMKFFAVFEEEFVPAVQSGNMTKAHEIAEGPLKQHYNAHRSAIDEVVTLATKNFEASESEAQSFVFSSNVWLVIIGLAIVLIFIAAGWLIANKIATPLGEVSAKLEAMAVGDLEQTFEYNGHDEIARLGNSFRSITSYIRNIAQSVDALASGDLSGNVEVRSDRDTLSKNLNRAKDSLRRLLGETEELYSHALKGDMAYRGKTDAYGGSYRELVEGINLMMDAVSKPITEASRCLHLVASRDLTAQMAGNYDGEFASIKDSLNTALENLNEGMSQISEGAEQVAEAASQISVGSASLAQSSSEQASTLEEVASSVQEISAMTKQNAANALEARSLSENARRTTVEGKENMSRLNDAVGRIKSSSDSTVKIVKTIEEIAFQTNLLALNAAVEAARAGDAGKGFAVVAEEVRNLAMRSAEAAKTTAELIDESVKNTMSGVVIHREVSQNLDDVLVQIEKVSAVSAEIAAATEQQTDGIEQINSAFEQMNIVTQQTAANSEESASAAEELSGQSQEMLSLIGSFNLKRSRTATHARISPTAAAGKSAPLTKKAKSVKARWNEHMSGEDLIPFHDETGTVLTSF